MEEENIIMKLIRELMAAIKNWIKAIVRSEIGEDQENGGGVITPPVDPKPVDPKPVDPKPVEPEPEPEPEAPTPDKCNQGPEIKKITVKSPREVEVVFHADKMYESEISIKASNNRLIHSQKFVHTNNSPVLNLNEDLKDEEYRLEFKATSCTGFDSLTFRGPKQPCRETGKIIDVTLI